DLGRAVGDAGLGEREGDVPALSRLDVRSEGVARQRVLLRAGHIEALAGPVVETDGDRAVLHHHAGRVPEAEHLRVVAQRPVPPHEGDAPPPPRAGAPPPPRVVFACPAPRGGGGGPLGGGGGGGGSTWWRPCRRS